MFFRPGEYELTGMISHIGANTGCGHYVAHLRKQLPEEHGGGKEWVMPEDAARVQRAPPLATPAAAIADITAAAPVAAAAAVATTASPSASVGAAWSNGRSSWRSPKAPPELLVCNHCGRAGHEARSCSFGLAEGEAFLRCRRAEPCACFARTFIVPLRRAPPAFSAEAPREGRVDVGLRCASAALFRSQSLRQNTQLSLCLMGEAAPRLLQVRGALVRDLRPDEQSMAARLRAVSDAEGAAAAAAEAQAARDALAATGGAVEAVEAVEAWSRSPRRGLSSRGGGILDAVKAAFEEHAASGALLGEGEEGPPLLLLLSAHGDFVGEVIPQELLRPAQGGRAEAPASSVVVVLGDDRGLEPDEERQVRAAAAAAGARVRSVSLGSDMLFASHAIVLVHHYLDRLAHSCLARPPREYARGGGRGGARGGRGRGRGWEARGGRAARGLTTISGAAAPAHKRQRT